MRPFFFLTFLFLFPLLAVPQEKKVLVPDSQELILQLSPTASIHTLIDRWNRQNKESFLTFKEVLSSSLNIHLIHWQKKEGFAKSPLPTLERQADVLSIQTNHSVQFRTLPNDPLLSRQWSVEKTALDQAWDITTGGVTAEGDTIVIAILDQGFDVDHEDLRNNIWYNYAEVPFDGIDNDQNGYVDDRQGWNFESDSPDFLPSSHGTSVAGIVGAQGNNGIGVAGVNWTVRLMLFQISEVAHIISAYEYVIQQRQLYQLTNGREGAFIVATNASFGVDDIFCSEEPVWGSMYDELGRSGILTGSGASNRGTNIDLTGDTPSTCNSSYLITVLNSNEMDAKEANSSYSTTHIDLASPGENSYTTKPSNRYGLFGDNSAAAPHLTGAIGLLYAAACPDLIRAYKREPAQTALLFKELLLESVDLIPGLEQYTATGGRLNVARTMALLENYCEGSQAAELSLVNVFPNPAWEEVVLDYTVSSGKVHRLEVFDVLGRLVWKKEKVGNLVSSLQREWIEVENWPAGIYVVRIEAGGKYVQGKMIKQ